jgi:hypothetical protein
VAWPGGPAKTSPAIVSPTSGDTVEPVNQVIHQELAVLPKKTVELGLKLD